DRKLPSNRAGVPYPPEQRVSWLASLLPHLGHEELYQRIKFDKSWQDPDNLGVAGSLIPHFLDAGYPRNSWWVRYPGVRQDLAPTHLVGMAGIGLDAAEYDPADPQTKSKLGVFGYNRAAKASDITDGLAHTILMIQVPPTYKRPWMAGGGSTVMGVPDPPPTSQKSVTPFVSRTHDGKRGTYAIMCDGSVRFIAEDISDDVFKAMCTIQGGEPKFLDKEVPPVKPPENFVVLQSAEAPKSSDTQKPAA